MRNAHTLTQPGSVALHKLRWAARLEPEYIANFKVLQDAFQKHGIERVRIQTAETLGFL